MREGTQTIPGSLPAAGGAVAPSPWGAVHSLRAEAGRQAENQQACWEPPEGLESGMPSDSCLGIPGPECPCAHTYTHWDHQAMAE